MCASTAPTTPHRGRAQGRAGAARTSRRRAPLYCKPRCLVVGLGTLVTTAVVAAAVGVRCGTVRGTGVAALATAPVAAILGATLIRDGWPRAFDVGAGFHWADGGWLRFTSDFGRSEEIFLNVALFVPAGIVLTAVRWRAMVVLGSLTMLSAAVETAQGVLCLGTPDLSDFLSNIVGSAVGIVVGATVACLRPGAVLRGQRRDV